MNQNRYVVAINGQNAVNAARKFLGGSCCKGIFNHGQRIAQIEITIDEPGEFNGLPNKWIDATIFKPKDTETVFNQLSRLGVRNCPCLIMEEETRESISQQKIICSTII